MKELFSATVNYFRHSVKFEIKTESGDTVKEKIRPFDEMDLYKLSTRILIRIHGKNGYLLPCSFGYYYYTD